MGAFKAGSITPVQLTFQSIPFFHSTVYCTTICLVKTSEALRGISCRINSQFMFSVRSKIYSHQQFFALSRFIVSNGLWGLRSIHLIAFLFLPAKSKSSSYRAMIMTFPFFFHRIRGACNAGKSKMQSYPRVLP